MVVVRLEVVQVGVADGKRFTGLQFPVQDPFDGDVARQTGEGARVEALLLQLLEPGRHAGKVLCQRTDFVSPGDLGVIVEVPFGNPVGGLFQLVQRPGDVEGDDGGYDDRQYEPGKG